MKHDEAASSGDKPAEAKPSEAAVAEIKPAETTASDDANKKSEQPSVSAQAGTEPVKTEAPTGETAKASEPKVEAKTDDVKPDAAAPEMSKPVEKPADQVKSATGTVPDAPKDQARLLDTVKPAVTKPDPAAAPKHSGQIAVFISRKDQKLYVRQNFAPLYDAPVTIAPSDRPLGTHVFTAQVDKDDANALHWSVVSLPAPIRNAQRHDEDERATRRRKIAGVVEVTPLPVPDSATEALDRLTIPADAMARINESLSTGGSIIVSDQGINAGETGEGTDFIVSLR